MSKVKQIMKVLNDVDESKLRYAVTELRNKGMKKDNSLLSLKRSELIQEIIIRLEERYSDKWVDKISELKAFKNELTIGKTYVENTEKRKTFLEMTRWTEDKLDHEYDITVRAIATFNKRNEITEDQFRESISNLVLWKGNYVPLWERLLDDDVPEYYRLFEKFLSEIELTEFDTYNDLVKYRELVESVQTYKGWIQMCSEHNYSCNTCPMYNYCDKHPIVENMVNAIESLINNGRFFNLEDWGLKEMFENVSKINNTKAQLEEMMQFFVTIRDA